MGSSGLHHHNTQGMGHLPMMILIRHCTEKWGANFFPNPRVKGRSFRSHSHDIACLWSRTENTLFCPFHNTHTHIHTETWTVSSRWENQNTWIFSHLHKKSFCVLRHNLLLIDSLNPKNKLQADTHPDRKHKKNVQFHSPRSQTLATNLWWAWYQSNLIFCNFCSFWAIVKNYSVTRSDVRML